MCGGTLLGQGQKQEKFLNMSQQDAAAAKNKYNPSLYKQKSKSRQIIFSL